MAEHKKAADNVVQAMVDQHRVNTGRGETPSELAMYRAKVESIARRADPRIEQTKRDKEKRG